jgi:adenylate cyclase
VKEQRKLAAIMFTDIVGYTALMSKDEQHAHQIIHKSRDILKSLIGQYNGQWVQNVGDATMSSFPSVVEAVNCALEIQRSLRDTSEISIRIGIHIGDVVFEEGEIYGDGVNVASRLEPLAEPGGICISGRVYSEIRNKPGMEAVFLGEKNLKNVDYPLKIYALAVEGQPPASDKPFPAERPFISKRRPSIAVLPFINLSADPEQEYFCDGIAEEIINALTHVQGLNVVALTSALAFKGKHEDIREIGRKLNVDKLLEGSVRKVGNRLRITAQLINVADGYHLWSERYDREMKNVFAIQDEISMAVVKELEVKLLGKEKTAIVRRHTENLEAHNLYLMGRYFWNKRYEVGLQKGLDYFQQAIAEDPNYALAYAGIADSYNIMAFWGYLSSGDTIPKAKAAAQKALLIDATLAEALTSLAWISANYDFDWATAEGEYKRAIALNPGYPTAHNWYSVYFMNMGRFNEALEENKRAQELDPLSIVTHYVAGEIFRCMSNYDEAIERFQRTIAIEPHFGIGYCYLGLTLSQTGKYKEAVVALQKALELTGHLSWPDGILGYIYALAGERDKAGQIILQMKAQSRDRYIALPSIALIHAGLGETDKAIKLLEKAHEERSSLLLFSKLYREKGALISDARYIALLKRIGLDR